ncbi:MAG TPA: glutamate--tRNA ligase, partial [Lacisediminihabitans sp.]|nr:glutamate--tRNA ligase [Lacisediminihabitans sp.]
TPAQKAILREAGPLVQERMQLLGDAPALLGFLFTPDDEITYDEDALPGPDAAIVLDAAIATLEQLNAWSHEELERVLRASLVDGAGLKPRVAFGPLRTAISGKRISPPLFESMVILGKESTLARLERFRKSL